MIPLVIKTLDDRRGFTLAALLDCGATSCYIDKGFAESKFLNMERLPRPIPVYNADGTPNEAGPIEHVVHLRLEIGNHSEVFPFAVTNTGKTDLIIGYNWLLTHNPTVDWRTGKLTFNRCPAECRSSWDDLELEDESELESEDNLELGDRIFMVSVSP